MSIMSPGDDMGTGGVQRPSYSMSGGVASCSDLSRGRKRFWLNNERLGVGICGLWIVSFGHSGLDRCGMWCIPLINVEVGRQICCKTRRGRRAMCRTHCEVVGSCLLHAQFLEVEAVRSNCLRLVHGSGRWQVAAVAPWRARRWVHGGQR